MATQTTIMLSVGERLSIARSRAGVGVQEMANRLGKHRNRISAYESAESLPLKLIELYADKLGNVTAEWLAFEIGEPPGWRPRQDSNLRPRD